MNNILEIVDKQKCTGCGACETVCPIGCIHIKMDEEGFLTPFVIEADCLQCGKCKSVCHTLTSIERNTLGCVRSMLYASENKSFFFNGTSGGAFGMIAQRAISHGYKVYGAAFSEDFSVRHISISDEGSINRIQGSKYVQSDTRSLFSRVDEELHNGRHVLFSGTPCQIAALRAFLNRDDPNLATVDIVCHGVPSPVFWSEDIKSWTKDETAKVRFRNKVQFDRYGYALVIETGTVKRVIPWQEDVYYKLFMDSLSLRECCYSCPYASVERPADITLGDCASMADYKEFDKTEVGTSVYVNTPRGSFFIEMMYKKGLLATLDKDKEIARNKQLSMPASRPSARDVVYKDFNDMPFDQFRLKYLGTRSFLSKLRLKIKKHVSWRFKLKTRRLFSKLELRRD